MTQCSHVPQLNDTTMHIARRDADHSSVPLWLFILCNYYIAVEKVKYWLPVNCIFTTKLNCCVMSYLDTILFACSPNRSIRGICSREGNPFAPQHNVKLHESSALEIICSTVSDWSLISCFAAASVHLKEFLFIFLELLDIVAVYWKYFRIFEINLMTQEFSEQ